MNILLINHYAGSPKHGMEFRSHCLAREWVKLGHAATVVAASRSHLRVQQPNFAGPSLEEEIDGVRYVWLKTPDYRGNGFRRVLNMLAFVAQLRRFRKRLAEQCRPDAVIASSTYRFEAYSARAIARRCRAPLIYEVRDLWPLTQIELGGMSPWHPFVMMMQRAENFAYASADHVVSTLPAVEEHLRRHGLREGRFTYIPNGIDVEQWRSQQAPLPAEHARAIEKLRGQGRFLVGYAGTHGHGNSLETLIDAAAILKEHPLGFVLVGQGPEKERLQEKAKQLGLDAVAFLPSRSSKRRPRAAGGHGRPVPGLAETPHLPLRHQPEQTGRLHDGRQAGDSRLGGGQRPRGRKRLRRVLRPDDSVGAGQRDCATAGAQRRGARGDGATGPGLRLGPSRLRGARPAIPGRADRRVPPIPEPIVLTPFSEDKPAEALCRRIEEFFGGGRCFLFAKGRVGLYVGLRALGLPPGGESPHAGLYVRRRPRRGAVRRPEAALCRHRSAHL